VVIETVISSSGEVGRLSVIEPSRYPVLEKAAIKAIEKAQPFPQFPEGLSRESIAITIPIHFLLR
jgi:protein TonB